MSDKRTRQELSWLLTQEARGAAERLRQGAHVLADPIPVAHLHGERPSERPLTLASAGEHGEGLDSTLDLLDGAVQRLAEMSGPTTGRARRGRVDLAALLWEVAPDATVQLEPGAGTEVYADEADLRRMLHVLLGGAQQSGLGGAQRVTLRREGEEVRLGVELGPDTAPISPAERGWLSRMAMRFGGRYELEGAAEFMVFQSLDGEDNREIETLRRELEAAKAQGEAYARELAAVFAEEPARSSGDPGSHDVLARDDDPDEAVTLVPSDGRQAPATVAAVATVARLAAALTEDLRAVCGPLGAAQLRAGTPSSAAEGELLEEVRRALGRGAELLALLRQMARIGAEPAALPVDLVQLARYEAQSAAVVFASRGVHLRLALGDIALPLVGHPTALRAVVAELLDAAARTCARGDEVRLGAEEGALLVERIGAGNGAQAWTRSTLAFVNEIARSHAIELEVSEDRSVARPSRVTSAE